METIRAAGYARHSLNNQCEESINAQIKAIEDYATSYKIQVVNFYIDRVNFTDIENFPEFKQMINDAKYCNFSYIIVHKLHRFSRNRYDSTHYKYILKQYGVSVQSTLESLDSSPASTIIMESVLTGMSEYYCAKSKRGRCNMLGSKISSISTVD